MIPAKVVPAKYHPHLPPYYVTEMRADAVVRFVQGVVRLSSPPEVVDGGLVTPEPEYWYRGHRIAPVDSLNDVRWRLVTVRWRANAGTLYTRTLANARGWIDRHLDTDDEDRSTEEIS